MFKKIVLITIFGIILISCAAMGKQSAPSRQVIVKVQTADPATVDAKTGDNINKSMEVFNPEGHLSQMSFIAKDKAFIKIFSGLSVADVTRLWSDLIFLENNTSVRDVNLFINSSGGDAFSGLALADQIECAKRRGVHITAHASGIIASAAVPVFAASDIRLASPGTIFMVHETSL
jgi:ATP-dependent protease ClpP protease subunit